MSAPSFIPSLFFSTFALIFVAELPDKTAFATLTLATRRRPAAVFSGVAAAFLVQTTVAVAFGRAFALLPPRLVEIASGLLFLAFAVFTARKRPDDDGTPNSGGPSATRDTFWRSAGASFLVIFIAEWGDLTQLATAALVAKQPEAIPTIFIAAVLALWSVTAVAIAVGSHLKQRLPEKWLQRAAAVAFALVGAIILYRAFAH